MGGSRPSGRDSEAEAVKRPGAARERAHSRRIESAGQPSNTLACAAPPLTPKPPRVGPRLKSNESDLFDLLRHRRGMRESRPRARLLVPSGCSELKRVDDSEGSDEQLYSPWLSQPW